MLWQAKNKLGNYVPMKTPSDYRIDWEDLDSNSYRNITNGNLIRSIVSTKWFKGAFTFNYITETDAEDILEIVNQFPLYIKIKSPLFGTNGWVTMECYVSKANIQMERNNETGASWSNLSFNIVQSKVVEGQ